MNRHQLLVTVFIVSVAISPAFALGEGNRNLLLIGWMSFSPIIWTYQLMQNKSLIKGVDVPLIAIMLMLIGLPYIFHPETLRWSTVLYSCMFCINFMAFAHVLQKGGYSLQLLSSVVKWILYAYCVVLIIQQFCVLFGLPIFNVSNYWVLDPWKLNSLMSEPSHAARVIPILMYIYIQIQKKLHKNYNIKESLRNDKWTWLAFIWPAMTMGASTFYVFAIFILFTFLSKKKIVFSAVLLFSVMTAIFFVEHPKIDRAKRVVQATLTLDEDSIISADHSASFRIVPTIRAAKYVGFTSYENYTGYGVDADTRLIPPIVGGPKVGSGGAFSTVINFGIMCGVLIWLWSFKICYIKGEVASLLIWFFGIFIVGGINYQISWLILILLYSFKYTYRNESRSYCPR